MAKKQSTAALRERVNGFAAGVALLDIYDYRTGDPEERVASFDQIPIQQFVGKLTERDERALPGFWMVIHDYLAVVGEGSVPDSHFYQKYANLSDDDIRKVRIQLGYESEARHG